MEKMFYTLMLVLFPVCVEAQEFQLMNWATSSESGDFLIQTDSRFYAWSVDHAFTGQVMGHVSDQDSSATLVSFSQSNDTVVITIETYVFQWCGSAREVNSSLGQKIETVFSVSPITSSGNTLRYECCSGECIPMIFSSLDYRVRKTYLWLVSMIRY
jgi:hypothetical protein